MLKSRELFMISSACVFGILLAATNFADRFVTRLPENAKIVSMDLDSDLPKILNAATKEKSRQFAFKYSI